MTDGGPADFQTGDPVPCSSERQGNCADAAVGINHPLIGLRSREPVTDLLHHPFCPGRVDLEERGGAEFKGEIAEPLLDRILTLKTQCLLTEHGVAALRLQVECHTLQLWPASHPFRTEIVDSLQIAGGGDQSDQDLSGPHTDPQAEVAKTRLTLQV